ncbi:MAG: NAD(P)H-dependent oxidoreductase [Betaproteobacteria bacterium]|nr:NAD(P)H-dependent oxidoreductase [Betaproteobacteria bacterium]
MARTGSRIVLIGGSTVGGLTTEKALRFTARLIGEMGGLPEVFAGPEIDLPMYVPENPERTPMARRIVDALRDCDGIVIASPGYHGTLSGMIKNVLDYAEDLAKDPSPYFHGRVVGLIGAARTARDLGTVLMSLRSVVHALRGWPTPLGVAIDAKTPAFDADGNCLIPALAEQLRLLAEQVMEFAGKRALLERAFTPVHDADFLAWE